MHQSDDKGRNSNSVLVTHYWVMPRIACLYIRNFALAAWYRVDPELRGMSVAVTEGQGARARVVACSPEAMQRGIVTEISAAQAMAVDANLLLRSASVAAERAMQAALCDVAYSFSPRVEDAGDGVAYLDCQGIPAVHNSENELARALEIRATTLGLDLSIGIASSKIAAQLAARDGDGMAVIAPEEEWHFLSPLPVQLLGPSPALQETLARWGIDRLGDLAALPVSAVTTRLGPEGLLLTRRARGEDDHPLVPRPPPTHFEETVELDYGVETLEPFVFVARALLDRLTARIALCGLICGDLRLSLGLVNRGRDERKVVVAIPSNDTKALLTLVRVHLEAHPPAAPVETIRITAVPEQLRPSQLDLFRPNEPAPARLSITLARLTALCGTERLGVPVVVDSHRPDAFALKPFGLSAGSGVRGRGLVSGTSSQLPTSNPRSEGGGVGIALRAIRPPRELEVFYDRGRLDFVRLTETPRGEACSYCCNGRVVTVAGPWRVQGEWWCAEAFNRDYYDVQLSDGAVYRLFFDQLRQEWFVDGVYD